MPKLRKIRWALYSITWKSKRDSEGTESVSSGAHWSVTSQQLKFEKDYQTRLNQLPSSSSSWPLVHAFQNADGGYLLKTNQFTTISARELADSLKLSLKVIEAKLVNLSKRHIVTYAGSGQFKFTSPVDMLSTKLKISMVISISFCKRWTRLRKCTQTQQVGDGKSPALS